MFTCDVIKTRKLANFDVSNVIYDKFSHGAVSYTLHGENFNIMLEFEISVFEISRLNIVKYVRQFNLYSQTLIAQKPLEL